MRKNLFFGLVAILGLIGCSRNQEIDVPDANLSLFARTESPADTKTVVESGVHVFWEPGDEIAVFMGEQSAKFTTDITAASGTATFKGTFGDTTWPEDLDLWAVYPFSEEVVFDGETITTTLPSEQVAREGSFGKDMNLAIAHSTGTTLQFYNVGGGIRFSVTEEGIKKVMFEGLSGEIISGKVKIGFEDGRPIVKEVTGGSQFITLLPPTGQETFQPGAWYYIVAIPGSLEGGYKLRFYKDSDYARKVSEKAVEIKRSIFGSLYKADDGIEYEATTAKFPETDEEWEETDVKVTDINTQIQIILDNLSLNGEARPSPNSVANEVLMIDGVVSAIPSEDGNMVYLRLQNGVYVNILLEDLNESFGGAVSRIKDEGSIIPQQLNTIPNTASGKKALVLLPLYDEVISNIGEHAKGLYAKIISSFETCGFEVTPYYNDEATISKFRGKNLELYDAVYINTHGTNQAMQADGKLTTALLTRSVVSPDTGQRWGNIPTYVLCVKSNDVYYWMSTDAYKYDHPHFNNTWLFIHACKGLARDDMYQYFLDCGAGACSGFLTNASIRSSVDFAADLIDAFASGMELFTASNWAINHSLNQFGEPWSQGESRDNYYMARNADLASFYLFDSKPYDLKNKIDGFVANLHWRGHPHTGDYSYRLFVNNILVATIDDNSSNEFIYEYNAGKLGEFSWFVQARNSYDIRNVEYYQSQEDYFTIEGERVELEAIDLGLSVKWANMNLGASRPAAHGDYYAWGEVEPYYSNLNPLTWKEGKEGGYAWSSYKWCEGRENTLTKYCNDSNYGYNGFTDYLTELEPEDDAAYVKLGGYWRMPTRPELVELYNCTWVYTTIDGVTGYKVTGSNSNSIFLPLNLPWHRDGKRDTVRGSYWGSTGYSLFSSGIGFFMPPYDDMSDSGYPRYYGLSIRPVYDEPDSKPRIHASPTAINYGDVKVGEGLGNATGRVTFTNTGGSDLSISKFDCPDGFSHSSAYSFPIVIPPGSDKTIVFAFKPTEAKTYSGDVIVYSNASNGGCEIRVTGRGIE